MPDGLEVLPSGQGPRTRKMIPTQSRQTESVCLRAPTLRNTNAPVRHQGICYLLAAFCFAHLFFCAAAILARPAALIFRLFVGRFAPSPVNSALASLSMESSSSIPAISSDVLIAPPQHKMNHTGSSYRQGCLKPNLIS